VCNLTSIKLEQYLAKELKNIRVELLESLLRRYIEDIEEDITTQEFYRSGYFLRRIPEER